ncbi:MAG: protein kinase [Xanthomonadales bacterium]|nr:protein kinase [Xanthomonadales bacterium]
MESKSIVDLFNECYELDQGQQKEYLTKLKAKTPELAAELEKLLAAEPTRFGLGQSSESSEPLVNTIPKQVAEYRITNILGMGGMGMVLLGHRKDIDLTVAIKVAHNSNQTEATKLALEQEAKVLASLEHPNIASIKDWGYLDKYGHYIATEFIDGDNIKQHCDSQQLNVTQIIKLFIKVVKAVSHAHSRLVLHRDIKPNNIMVSTTGEPKLIDFGVAKMLSSIHASEEQTISAGLTPSFASPEQLEGQPLSIKSDIYSLGLVLRELLFVHSPENKFKPQQNIEEQLQQTRQHNKSQWHGLNKQAVADLALVIKTATAEDLNLRYKNTEDFANDLNAMLSQRPINAREPSPWYRFKKLISRNKLTAAFSGGTLMIALAGYTFGVWYFIQASKANDLLIKKNQDLESYSNLQAKTFRLMDVNSGGDPKLNMEQFLEKATQTYYEEKDVDLERMAWHGRSLASIYSSWGMYEKALIVLEKALYHAELSSTKHDDVSLLTEKALTFSNNKAFEEGITAAKEALTVIEHHPETKWRRDVVLIALSSNYESAGFYEESIKTLELIISEPQGNPIYQAYAYSFKGTTLSSLYRFNETIESTKLSIPLFLERYGEESAQVINAQAKIFFAEVKQNPTSFDEQTAESLILQFESLFLPDDPSIAALFSALSETYFLAGFSETALNYQENANEIFKKESETLADFNIGNIKLAEYHFYSGQIDLAKTIIDSIQTEDLHMLSSAEQTKYHLFKAAIALSQGNQKKADNELNSARQMTGYHLLDDVLSHFHFRQAQSKALKTQWNACLDEAKKAYIMAKNIYPKTWQIHNGYRYLADVCQLKLEGKQPDKNSFPYLQAVLDSPWKQETVLTTKILNAE